MTLATKVHQRKGFTLLSVMVAMVMLTIGILGLARTLALSTVAQGQAASRTASLAIARGYMEMLRGQSASSIVAEPPQTVDADGQPSPDGKFIRSVDVVVETANLKRVRVMVQAPRIQTPTVIETLIYVRTV